MFIFAISRNFWILLLSSGLAVSFMNAVTPLTDRIGVSSPYLPSIQKMVVMQ